MALGDNDVRLVIITQRSFPFYSVTAIFTGEGKSPLLSFFLRHLIGRVLKTSSNGFHFEREISMTAISKAASKNRLVIST